MRPATTVAFLALSGWLEVTAAVAAPRAPEGGPGCPGLQAEQEPNDTAASATLILEQSPTSARFAGIYGSITVPGDVDWFRFDAPAGSRLWLSVDTGVAATGSRDTVVSIFAPDGVSLIESDDDDGTGNGRDFTIESLDASLVAGRVLSLGGTYYARVAAKVPEATVDGYSLLIAVSTFPVQAEVEPNDIPPCQPLWSPPFPVLGSLSSSADVDCYAISVLDNGFPFVLVNGDPERDGIGTDVTLRLTTLGGQTIVTDSSGAGDASNPPAEAFAIQEGGYAYVTGTGPGTYIIAGWWSGDGCQVPLRLQSIEID
jgi:hypothetical protein